MCTNMMIWIAVILTLTSFCQSAPASRDSNCDTIGCLGVWMPVCGTDGKTYGNKCELGLATCKDSSVTLQHQGECGGNPFVLRSVDGCPMACFAFYDPVCGTDGITYSNACQLAVVSCQTGGTINMKHKGGC